MPLWRRPPDRQDHREPGITGLGFHADIAVVTAYDDPVADVQAKARPVANVLGREERLENAAL